ncbi:MAG: hypothetical protein EG826_16090 [Deltaproteobacteria bacterium]|nr:hypothetical protein [Deltaproteobacteria bacterium]
MILILATILAVFAVGLFYAPGFLSYSTHYAHADAVILLLGPDFNARQKHARDLIEKGMADYLIIPAYGKTYHFEQGVMRLLPAEKDRSVQSEKTQPILPQYYEDTHLELIKAKRTMTLLGRKSAIFVSSPYHMRRIRIMVNKEFDLYPLFYFSPTPYDPAPLSAWELSASDWKKIWREYIKIAWFMIYFPWTR